MIEVARVDTKDPYTTNAVTAMLREFEIGYETILSFQGRMFIVFDRPRTALNALKTCANCGFDLRRVDTNASDVLLLKDRVPPAIRPRTDARVADRMISSHLGSNNNNSNNKNRNRKLGAAQREREWRDRERGKVREERQRRADLANDTHSSWTVKR